MSSGIYIIWVREFKAAGQHVYKFGRTKDIFTRFKDYPKGSVLVFFHICPPESLENAEGDVLSKIGDAFLQRREFGLEYFEGNLQSMIEVTDACLKDVLVVDMVNRNTPEAVTPEADPGVEIVNFVRSSQDILRGSRRCMVTLFDDYKRFVQQSKLVNKLSLEKFSVKFLKATGAKKINVRNGLLIETHVEFVPGEEQPSSDIFEAKVAQWCEDNLEVTGDMRDYVLLGEIDSNIPKFKNWVVAYFAGVARTLYVPKTSVKGLGSQRYVLKGVKRVVV